MKTYLVGGAVRDKLLGIESKDNDYVVVGSIPEEMIALGYKQVGADFPVFLHPETGDEYALARTEKKTGVGYNGFSCQFSPDVTLIEDLYRRDLTINAMAMDADGVLIDPYGGAYDLNRKIIRHVNPDAFVEDPVRVLRAARFAARYNFLIANATIELMDYCVKREFSHLTPERVWKEFEKGLGEKRFHHMMVCLEIVDAFRYIKPFQFHFKYREYIDFADNFNSSAEVKFALVSKGFTKEDFARLKVPNSFSELSLINSRLDFSLGSFSDHADILNFIEVSGVLKSNSHIHEKAVFDLVLIQNPVFVGAFDSYVEVLKTIDNVATIGGEKNGLKIKELVRQEKLRLIKTVV